MIESRAEMLGNSIAAAQVADTKTIVTIMLLQNTLRSDIHLRFLGEVLLIEN